MSANPAPRTKKKTTSNRKNRLKIQRLHALSAELQKREELEQASALVPKAPPLFRYVEGELVPAVRRVPGSQSNIAEREGFKNQMGKGRKAGHPNKVTKEVKEVILECFTRIGGIAAFAEWAKKNQTKFYYIYAKMLPINLQATQTKEINIYVSRDEAGI